MNNFKKYIVTGGAGFIGSKLSIEILKNVQNEVLIIDDLSTGSLDNLNEIIDNPRVKFLNSRVEDVDNLAQEIQNYDFCFHLAAGVGVQYIMNNLSSSLLTNILATHYILEACVENSIPVLITSTSEVYGTSEEKSWSEETKSLIGPTSKLRWSYAASKMIDEFMALSLFQENKLNPIIVRLFNIIGENQLSKFGMVVPNFVESALKNEDIYIHGDGNQSRSFTWIDDVINYLIKLSELKPYGQIFNIGQTEELTINELAKLIINKTNSTSKIIYKDYSEVYGNSFEDPMRRTPNIDKIVNLTGIKPSKNIEYMVEQIVNSKKNKK